MKKILFLFLLIGYGSTMIYCETIFNEEYYIVSIARLVFIFIKTNDKFPYNFQELQLLENRKTGENISGLFKTFRDRGYNIVLANNRSFLEVSLTSNNYNLSFIYRNNKFFFYENGELYLEFTWDNEGNIIDEQSYR